MRILRLWGATKEAGNFGQQLVGANRLAEEAVDHRPLVGGQEAVFVFAEDS